MTEERNTAFVMNMHERIEKLEEITAIQSVNIRKLLEDFKKLEKQFYGFTVDHLRLIQMLTDPDIRYYRGRHKMKALHIEGKKAMVLYLEEGYVGKKGKYKDVFPGEIDLVLTRSCNKERIKEMKEK